MSTKKTKSTKKNTKTATRTKVRAAGSTGGKASVRAKNKTAAKAYCKKMCKPNKVACIIAIIVLGVAAIVAVAFIMIASTFHTDKTYTFGMKTDAERFAAEYTDVDTDNVFIIKNGKETIDILEHGTGVVFLGFPSCPWCQRYAKYLNEVAKEKGIKKIYYHDTYDDWQNNTDDYQKITSILSDHLQYDNDGKRHLYVPDVVFVKDGVIVGNDYETSKYTAGANTPDEYWTEARVVDLKDRLGSFMELVKTDDCEAACDK